MKPLAFSMLLVLAACGGAPEAPDNAAPETAGTISPSSSQPPAPSAATCVPAPDRLCPVDEASRDPSFAAFREELTGIVERRDSAALLRAIDPAIRTTFGEGGGSDDFRTQWKLDAPDTPLWSELAAILALGGTFRGEGETRTFWAPYVFGAWPEEKDAFTHVAALGPDTEIRAEARADAPLMGTVHWEILELIMRDGFKPYAPWLEVRLPDGRTGFVRNEDVRGPIEWRAGFMKQQGEWKMVVLVAGD